MQAEQYSLRGEPEQAEEKYLQALEEARAIGQSSFAYGITLVCLGEFYRTHKRYQQAGPIFADAVAILQSCLHTTSGLNRKLLLQDLAVAKAGQGDSRFAMGAFNEAKSLYKESIALVEPWRKGKSDIYTDYVVGQKVALCLYKIALVDERTELEEESCQYYRQALSVAEKSALPYRLRKRILNDYNRALIPHCHRSASVTVENKWLEYDSQANQYASERNWPAAEKMAHKALLEAQKEDAQGIHVAMTLNSLLPIYAAQSKFTEAEKTCLLALALFKKLDTNPNRAESNVGSASAPSSKLDFLLSQQLQINQQRFSHHDLQIAQCEALLAYYYWKNNKASKANNQALKAYDLLLKLNDKNQESREAAEKLLEVLIDTNDFKRVQTLDQKYGFGGNR
ncbi:MAG: hypothetical protein K2W82_12575 [Candidatus Obscuribacterales bacterium]|nr:hypothetical protein [Candidatus Obscuribacterales bacterium]